MSCPNATAPIDIVRSIADECDLKCDYSFKYPITSVTADNKGDFIRLSFDPEKEPSVRFDDLDASVLAAGTARRLVGVEM